MTTHVQRPVTVTARINTSTGIPHPTTSLRDVFTITAHVNVDPLSFFGYQSGHTVAEVTTTDGTPLRMVFTTSRVTDSHTAAEAAFAVGNRQNSDDRGQDWPDDVRSLSVGDVLAVTAPDGTTTHLTVDSVGFSEILPPAVRTDLTGTRATSRTT
ncbi:hypothetical protein [Streptomyces sp. NPDC000410]|uniref:hypothetical protein n=1 Tax=Streptomyces sp. NPDC000410 TaxID=3154254 RepID=UPI00331E5B6B